MSFTVEKLEHSMAKLTITVPAEEFDKAMVKAYNKTKGRFNVPGFRKGKVPMAFIEKMYGPAVFYEDAANDMINEYYPKEAVASELEIASQPVIDVTQIEKGKDLIFTAEVAVKPEVTLGEYKGVEVDKIDVEVTEEEVLEDIKKEQLQNARKVIVNDRPAKLDDEITLDFEGFVDGVAFEGGKGENYKLVLGSHSFIDTFEDQLVGKSVGEDVEVNVTFPEDYQAEDLAGKPAVFKCKINTITESQLPELNDEFASEVGGCDTLDQYKAEVKEKLLAQKKKNAANEKEVKALDKVIENATMDIADAQVEDMQKRMRDEFAQSLQYQGINFEQYLQIVNVTEEAFLERVKPDALKRIQQRAVLEAVVKAENIEATDEEVDEELTNMANQYQMKLEDIKGFMGEAEINSIRKDVAVKKAAKLIVDEAKEV
jgi:trigger factor